MTRYGIDAATLLHAVEHDLPLDPAHRLVAPNRLRSQALQLLLDRVRAGELAERRALELHERITAVKVRLLGDRVSRRTAWNLAREHGWPTLDDAEYLAVAKLQADALVTVDPRLRALAEGVVPTAAAEALGRP